jgi:prepilin-type N-terminal cleavage/methylation domain-containing protein
VPLWCGDSPGLVEAHLSTTLSTCLRQRGFTIVEVIVVMIILGVLGALVVPRLVGVGGRQAEVEAESVRVLLSAFAQRDAIARQRVALAFDAARSELSVQALVPADVGAVGSAGGGEGQGGGDGDASLAALAGESAGAAMAWRNTGLIRPVRLALVGLGEVLVGGQSQPVDAAWRVTLSPAQTRPSLTLVLRERGGGAEGRAWQVDLPSAATGATIRGLAAGSAVLIVDDLAEDLDKQGRRSNAW